MIIPVRCMTCGKVIGDLYAGIYAELRTYGRAWRN